MGSRIKKYSFVIDFKFSNNLAFIQSNESWYIFFTKEKGKGGLRARLNLEEGKVRLSTLSPLEIEYLEEILEFMKAIEKEENK